MTTKIIGHAQRIVLPKSEGNAQNNL